MDEYTTEEMKYRNGFDAGFKKGYTAGTENGMKYASFRNCPESPYDGDVLECPYCGHGEYLHNQDGNKNKFCGQCGQALKWED